MSERFQVREGSQSAHCCFFATVVDTKAPTMMGDKPWAPNGVQEYAEVCECFSEEAAALIVRALNSLPDVETVQLPNDG